MEKEPLKKCAFCGAAVEGVGFSESGEFRCGRCGTTSRCEGEAFIAIFIPGYDARLKELECLNQELLKKIEQEGRKEENRDMQTLGRMHLARQEVLTEHAFLSHFGPFVEKW